jgi:hypothetical protein
MAESTKSRTAPMIFPVLAGFLTLECLWRLFVPGGPWPVRPWPYIQMGLDVLFLAALIASWRAYPDSAASGPVPVRRGGWLFALGLVSGAMMLLLRLTSEHAWWTGHLRGGGF